MEGKCKCTYVGVTRGFVSLLYPRGGGRGRVASDGGRTGKIPRVEEGKEGIEARTHVYRYPSCGQVDFSSGWGDSFERTKTKMTTL